MNFKIILGEQPRKVLKQLIEKDDKETIKELAKALEDLSANPYQGTPIVKNYDKKLLKSIINVKNKRIKQLGVFSNSLFKCGKDIDLEIGNMILDLYGVLIFYNGKKVSLDFLGRKIKNGIILESAEYKINYIIGLSGKNKEKFLIRANAVSISKKSGTKNGGKK